MIKLFIVYNSPSHSPFNSQKAQDRNSFWKMLSLHQITCQLAQLAALLSPRLTPTGKQILVSHAVYHIDKPVGLTVQIGLVYLLNITGKHHFCTFAGTGDDGLNLMWGQVLGFIDNTVGFAQAAPADKGQCLTNCSLFCISSKRFTSEELAAN